MLDSQLLLLILPLAALLAFLTTYSLTPRVILRLTIRGITGVDVHKPNHPKIPEMGGVVIAAGYGAGLLFLLAVFQRLVTPLLAALSSIFMVCMVGMVDDILTLSQKTKVILPVLAALPLMIALNTDRGMLIPFVGPISLGLLYPLILVPVGLVVASNLVNMLAGFNGLESGLGIITTTSLLVAAILTKHNNCAVILAPMIGALLAFLLYNKYPAKILPGNSGTYSIGATIAAAVIIGDMEVVGVICLIPFVIEFFIKARKRFKGQCFGVLNPDGTLSPPSNSVESITHIFMRFGRYTEAKLVHRLWILGALFGLLAILIAYLAPYYALFKP